MSKRDPVKTQRNRTIKNLTEQIKKILPEVLEKTHYGNELSLNSTFGGKMQEFAGVKSNSFTSVEEFIATYLNGLISKVSEFNSEEIHRNPFSRAFLCIKKYSAVRKWLSLFLERTYLRNYDDYSRNKPSIEESLLWIGHQKASYGIAVVPRFREGQWENDKSEIRSFSNNYFTIGHILETGFLVPFVEDKIEFNSVDGYLSFFKNSMVRGSGSQHEMAIAERYCEYVKLSNDPNNIPLLIPEYRYDGIEKKHLHRLDFCIINYLNFTKVGIELSPWSTHGLLKNTKKKTQKVINAEAQNNFHMEITKLKNYFRKYGITTLVYTNQDLKDYDLLFNNISKYLVITKQPKQLLLNAFDTIIKMEI